ncbi:universal stress protein [Asticcacaulis sp. 201]|uniref:universal stress protein n=1 Tax=Asticcacaulis sp. 201 TaxID=3028787 RepID=UPI002916C134|nr:universal stress protein [Asticcacaulis sp. 201]MDV6330919.1 universal stress protein [Asticcacaulis sp. 201]
MSIKSILCVFSGNADEDTALSAAFNMAYTAKGSLRVLHIAAPPILYGAAIGATYASGPYPSGDLASILEKDARELTETALKAVIRLSKTHMVSLVEDGIQATAGRAQASFRALVGTVSECLPSEGRSVDLVVAGYDNSYGGNFETILAALFKTGSPVLAIPRLSDVVVSETGYARTVAVAWDGSLAASRALRAAMPYLVHAETVYLVSVEGMNDPVDTVGNRDIIGYLAVHGISAQFIHCERVAHSIGHILLEKADDLKADLLVTGAYGRGHIGEMILGGVSNHLLKHSRLPLFLAH